MATSTEEVFQTVKALREEIEKSRPDPVKMKKMHAFLDGMEDENQKLVAEKAAQVQKQMDLEEKVCNLEIEVARNSGIAGNGKSYRESAEYKALHQFCLKGLNGITHEEKQTLRTDIDPQGGFLVPVELDNVLVKKIVEISPIRSIARVRTTAAKTLNVPVRNTIPVAEFEGEAQAGSDSNSTYQEETMTPFRLTYTAPITSDMLMDAAFDMESEIMSDGAEAFAFAEGNSFVTGSGFKSPTGFLSDTRVTSVARQSEIAGVLSADDILLITGDLKTGYNGTFVMNRRTLAQLRTQKSTTGQYLWLPGINGVVSNTLAGDPYIIANEMPDTANNSFPLAYGDFMRGYTILDRTGLSVIRDDVTAAQQAIIKFTLRRYLTGQVILPEAIKVIQITSTV